MDVVDEASGGLCITRQGAPLWRDNTPIFSAQQHICRVRYMLQRPSVRPSVVSLYVRHTGGSIKTTEVRI